MEDRVTQPSPMPSPIASSCTLGCARRKPIDRQPGLAQQSACACTGAGDEQPETVSRSQSLQTFPLIPFVMPFVSRFASLLFVALLGCGAPDPQAIVDRSIAVHGGDVLRHSVVEFDYRGKHFKVIRDGGLFSYERTYTDSTGRVREVLNNDGVFREVDGARVPLDDARRRSIESGINSVVYFTFLPFPLNDPAVRKRYLGETTIDGEPYHEIEVTFEQEGGGRDYQDRYVYWIHREHYTMDYLAYTFESDGGGTRFRRAVNPRVVGGVRFADFENYTAPSLGTEIRRYDEVLQRGGLEHVSHIAIDRIRVRPEPGAAHPASP